MCTLLQVPRSTYDYVATKRDHRDKAITEAIKKIFHASRRLYGGRKIKEELDKLSLQGI